MKRSLLASLRTLVAVAALSTADAYTHPGIPLTIADLEAVKAKVAAGEQPWKAGYDALAADRRSQLGYTMQGPFATVTRNPHLNRNQWMNDMQAVWNLARMWYFTGNTAYAQKSRDILIAWAKTQKSFGGMEANLDLGDYAFRFAGGADILRGTWSGWTTADTAAVKALFNNVYWPATGAGGSTLGPANKGGLSLAAATAIAVFNDDQTKFDQVLNLLRTCPTTGFVNTLANGEHGETGRDQGHSYGQMLAMSFIAEVLWKQGIDVYSERDNRLLAMGEYYARFNLAVKTPYVPMGTTDEYYLSIWDSPGFGAEPMAFSILKSAYVLRKGMSAPYLERKLAVQADNMEAFMFLKPYDRSSATPPPAVTFPGASPTGSGLINLDIGGASPAGSGTHRNGVWTVRGAGSEIWTHGAESFHFLYKQVTGDCTIIAKVNSVQDTHANAKAGVMIRSDLNAEPTSKAWIAVTPSTKIEAYMDGWSEVYGGSNWEAQSYPVPQIPYWVKIERRGNIITAYTSPDGTSWGTIVTGRFDNMGSSPYLGLAVCSLAGGTLNTSTFSNVSVTGGSGGTVTVPAAPLAVYGSPGAGEVPLRWLPSFGAASYTVKRAAASGGPYTNVATGLTGTSHVDTTVSNNTTYHYVVTATNSAGTSPNSPQETVTPRPAMVNLARGGTATASANGGSSTEGAAKGFDRNSGSKWFNGNSGTKGWLQYDLGTGVTRVVRRYDVVSASDMPGRDPKDWQFQGSNDGSNWTTLDTRSNQSFPYRLFPKSYAIGNTTAYRHYRLNVTANNGDATGLQFAELSLMGPYPADRTDQILAPP
jgi:regulation of enolase protein 1 (concanavalin A-like superfamily)